MQITCEVQRRGVASLRVSAVDVFWGAEFLNSGEAALLGSVQQGSVAPQQVLDVRVSIFDHVQRHVAVSVLLGWISAVLKTQGLSFSLFCIKVWMCETVCLHRSK